MGALGAPLGPLDRLAALTPKQRRALAVGGHCTTLSASLAHCWAGQRRCGGTAHTPEQAAVELNSLPAAPPQLAVIASGGGLTQWIKKQLRAARAEQEVSGGGAAACRLPFADRLAARVAARPASDLHPTPGPRRPSARAWRHTSGRRRAARWRWTRCLAAACWPS